jgi:hypothetical protein
MQGGHHRTVTENGTIVADLTDYEIVRDLVGDLMTQDIGVGVPMIVRETRREPGTACDNPTGRGCPTIGWLNCLAARGSGHPARCAAQSGNPSAATRETRSGWGDTGGAQSFATSGTAGIGMGRTGGAPMTVFDARKPEEVDG